MQLKFLHECPYRYMELNIQHRQFFYLFLKSLALGNLRSMDTVVIAVLMFN